MKKSHSFLLHCFFQFWNDPAQQPKERANHKHTRTLSFNISANNAWRSSQGQRGCCAFVAVDGKPTTLLRFSFSFRFFWCRCLSSPGRPPCSLRGARSPRCPESRRFFSKRLLCARAQGPQGRGSQQQRR